MYLYIDETETDDYFIVCGLLTPSKETTELAFRKFKNRINHRYIPPKQKATLFSEFKSTLLDHNYRFIRSEILKTISDNAIRIVCCRYKKTSKKFKQSEKEKQYLRMLSKVLYLFLSYNDINVVFDKFCSNNFNRLIINKSFENLNVISCLGEDSRLNHGIQFVDNICGIVRLKLLNQDRFNQYDIVSEKIINISI